MVLAWLLGTLSPALAGILVIALAYGRVGLRDLRSQLFRWRVGVRWYAVALLTVPLLMTAILAALSLSPFSPPPSQRRTLRSCWRATSWWGWSSPSSRRSAGQGSQHTNSESGMDCWRPDSFWACRGA